MKIRPRNIPKFQYGGVPQWYLDRYGNRTALLNWDLDQRYDYANKNLNTNDHRNAGNLDTVYRKNMAYTGTPGAISSDIQSFYNSDGKGMSAEDFVNFYNQNAAKIRNHWAKDQTYNANTAKEHNQLYKRMFASRSDQSMSPGSDYNIGYQNNLENIEGSSTWLRRMDQYEKEFDPTHPDSNRLHEITLSNGAKAIVYKKANGDIGLMKNSPSLPQVDRDAFSRSLLNTKTTPQIKTDTGGEIDALEIADKESFADKLRAGLKNVDVAGLIDGVRLAGNLINNQRVYDIVNKSIRPALQSTYRTHRQVVGDEATKQAYYRRAAQGQTHAAKPFTSDADRQMAYQFEAKRVGDELRAQGDLADNQEIRRTSDESNQHQWDNIRRATDVANQNKIAMLDAQAKKAQLLAQKESSDWTNIDQFLLGKQAKIQQKQAEEKAWNRQLTELQVQQNLLNDEELQKLNLDRQDAYTAWENAKPEEKEALKSKVTEANKKYQNRLLQLRRDAIQLYKDSVGSYKSGSKLEYKYKDNTDKYLYKTSRDIVEHFRKMSKMTDDSRIRSREKKIKLEPHPRGNTRKYQQGGLAPFTIYRPLGVGGESAVSSQVSSSAGSNSSSEKKSDKEKDKLDLAKKLFESLKGLPVDVNMAYKEIFSVFNKAKMFGEDLSTDDIASLYLSSMQKLNTLQHSQEAFKNATTNVTAKDGLQEYAVAADGRVVVQNQDTAKIEYKRLEDILDSKGKYNPLTNNQLLQLRAHSPELAFDDNILNVVNAGIGINKIGAEIKSLAGTIGSSESKLEGISQVEANKVRAGLQILAGTDGTPDGYYQVTNESKDSKAKVAAALRYIENVLPESYKTILKLHGGPNIEATIAGYLSSGTSDYSKQSIAPLTGKASDNDKTNNGINSNLLDQIQRDQIGVDRPFEIITKDGNTKLYSLNSKSISQLPNVNQDMSIDRMLSESKVGTIMDSRLGVTFGDQIISPENFKDIMFDSAHDVQIVTLPCKIINGHKVVNFAIKDEFDNAIKEASKVVPIDYSNPQFIKVLSQKLHEKGLDSLLNGDNIDPNMFGHFMVVSAYTTDRIKFNTNSRYIEKVKNPDSDLEDRIVKGLSTNKDKNDYELDVDDKFGFFELTYDDVYRGNVFIPLNNDPVSAQTGWGGNVNLNEARSLAEDYQNFQKSSKQKESSSSVLQ